MHDTICILSEAYVLGCPSFANVLRGGDDPVKIVITEEQSVVDNTQINRSPAKLLVECYYYPFTNNIEFEFLSNVGMVTVLLENQVTGEVQCHYMNSVSGRSVISVEPESVYVMNIITESERHYYAMFHSGSDSF